MTFFLRLENAQKLWKFALPTVPLPPNETWTRWLATSLDEEVEKVVALVPVRRSRGDLQTDLEVYKFVSAVLGRYRQARQREKEIGRQHA